MTCFHPLHAFKMFNRRTPSGKSVIVFSENKIRGKAWEEIKLKCGQCIGCRVDSSKAWAIRCVHEAQCWPHSEYVTLTLNPEYLEGRRTLVKSEFQKFMKRLRKANHGIKSIKDDNGNWHKPIRYFVCGEYGELCLNCGFHKEKHHEVGCRIWSPTLGRPHFHACIFNYEFTDKYYWCTRHGNKLYRSESLERLWSIRLEKGKNYGFQKRDRFTKDGIEYAKIGFITIGECNFRSAGYIARYVTKKVNGSRAASHYRVVNTATGEIETAMPEYVAMSNRPGIGAFWYKRYGYGDCWRSDRLTVGGRTYGVPAYYFKLLERTDPKLAREIKRKRVLTAKANAHNMTPERLRAAKLRFINRVAEAMERRYENGTNDVCGL